MDKKTYSALKKLASLDSEYAVEARQTLEEVDTAKLRIAVLGSFSSGKSTLIGAMLGGGWLPARTVPTTAHPVVIRNGRPAVTVEYKGGAVQRIPLGSVRGDEDSAEISRRILGDGYEKDAVRRYVLECGAPFLTAYAELLDSPGSNSVEKGHSEIAAGIAEAADIAVYVLNATQPLGKTDLEGLAACAEAAYLFILLNKIDLVDEDEQSVADILDSVRGHIEDKTNLKNYFLYPVSGKCRLDGSDKKIGLDHPFDPFMDKLAFLVREEGPALLEKKKERIVSERLGVPEALLDKLRAGKQKEKEKQKKKREADRKRKAEKKDGQASRAAFLVTGIVGVLLVALLIFGMLRAFDRRDTHSWLGFSGPSVLADRLGIPTPFRTGQADPAERMARLAVARLIRGGNPGEYLARAAAVKGASFFHAFNALATGRLSAGRFFRMHAVLLFAVFPVLVALFYLAGMSKRYLRFHRRIGTTVGWIVFLYLVAFLYFFVFMPGFRPLPDFYLRGGLGLIALFWIKSVVKVPFERRY